MKAVVCIALGILLAGCRLTDEERAVGEIRNDGLAAASDPEAGRAAAVVNEIVAAYRSGSRARVLELTDPVQRDRAYDKSIEGSLDAGSRVVGAEVIGTWAVVGVRTSRWKTPAVIQFIMHRVDDQWLVGAIFAYGLTEVIHVFDSYPTPPSTALLYLPGRRFTSSVWREETSIPAVKVGTSVDVPPDEDQLKAGTRLKFTVNGACTIRITATTDGDASPMLELHSPEGGERSSADENHEARGERYSQGPRQAVIEHGVWDGTYLVRARAKVTSSVRLSIKALPPTPRTK